MYVRKQLFALPLVWARLFISFIAKWKEKQKKNKNKTQKYKMLENYLSRFHLNCRLQLLFV